MQKVIKKGDNLASLSCFQFIDDTQYIISDINGLRIEAITFNQISWKIEEQGGAEFYLSPDKKQVLVVAEEVTLYDLEKKQPVGRLSDRSIKKYSSLKVAWNMDKTLLALGQSGKVYIWDLLSQKWGPTYETKYNNLIGLVFTDTNALTISPTPDLHLS